MCLCSICLVRMCLLSGVAAACSWCQWHIWHVTPRWSVDNQNYSGQRQNWCISVSNHYGIALCCRQWQWEGGKGRQAPDSILQGTPFETRNKKEILARWYVTLSSCKSHVSQSRTDNLDSGSVVLRGGANTNA